MVARFLIKVLLISIILLFLYLSFQYHAEKLSLNVSVTDEYALFFWNAKKKEVCYFGRSEDDKFEDYEEIRMTKKSFKVNVEDLDKYNLSEGENYFRIECPDRLFKYSNIVGVEYYPDEF